MSDKGNDVRNIIDDAVEKLIAVGATRPVALHLLAYQSVLRLCIDNEDATLVEVRDQINAEVATHLTCYPDETLQ